MSGYREQATRPSQEPVPVGLICPWCGEQAMGRVRKSLVGRPILGAKCAHCRKKVSLGKQSIWTWFPPAMAAHLWSVYVVFYNRVPMWTMVPVFLVGYGASFILHNRRPLNRD